MNEDLRTHLTSVLQGWINQINQNPAQAIPVLMEIVRSYGYIGYKRALEKLIDEIPNNVAMKNIFINVINHYYNLKTHATSVLVEVFDRSNQIFQIVINDINMPFSQKLLIACALSHSMNPNSVKIGMEYINNNTAQIVEKGPTHFSPNFIHNFLYFIATSPKFPMAYKKNIFTSFVWFYKNQLTIAPLFNHVNLNTTPDTMNPLLKRTQSATLMMNDIINSKQQLAMDNTFVLMQHYYNIPQNQDVNLLANVMHMGYALTSNLQAFSTVLKKSIPPNVKPEPMIARAIGFMSMNLKNKMLAKPVAQLMQALKTYNMNVELKESNTWNQDVFVEAINQTFPRVNWKQVIYSLDYNELVFKNSSEVALIPVLYRKATNKQPFPIEYLVNRTWKNEQAQLNMLLFGLDLPQNLMNFGSKQLKQITTVIPGKDVHINDAWKSIHFIETLLTLAKFENFDRVQSAFEADPMVKMPEQLLIALCESKPMSDILRDTLIKVLFIQYLERVDPADEKSLGMVVLKKMAEIAPNLFCINMYQFYDGQRQDYQSISLIVDIVQHIGFVELFAFSCVNWLPFSFDFAFMAAAKYRHYDLLLHFLLQQKQDAEILNKARQFFDIRRRERAYNGADMRRLMAAVNMETQFRSDIENLATEKLKQFIKKSVNLDSMVNLIKRFKNSNSTDEKQLYSCIIYTLFDEFTYINDLPALVDLCCALIKQNLLENSKLQIALALIFKEVRTPRQSGFLFLKHLGKELHKWPMFCALLKVLPSTIYEKVPNLHLYLEGRSEYSTYSGFKTNLDLSVILTQNNAFPAPTKEQKGKMNFILNTLTTENVASKASELKNVLSHIHYMFFANYFATQRISLEPNFHELYRDFLDAMNEPELNRNILQATFKCTKRILDVGELSLASSDGKLLRAFGNWIGLQTIARNEPILFTELDLKQVLVESVVRGTQLQVVQFVRLILKYAKDSPVFKPPNPWTMLILSIFSELISIENTPKSLKNEVDFLIREDLGISYKVIKKKSPRILAEVANVPEDNIFDELDFDDDRIDDITHNAEMIEPIIDVYKYPMFNTYSRLKNLVEYALNNAIQHAISAAHKQLFNVVISTTTIIVSNDFYGVQDVSRKRYAAMCMVQQLISNFVIYISCSANMRANMFDTLFQQLSSICRNGQRPDVTQAIHQVAQGITNDNVPLGIKNMEKYFTSYAFRYFEHYPFNYISPNIQLTRNIPQALFNPQGISELQQNVYTQYDNGRHTVSSRYAEYKGAPVKEVVAFIELTMGKMLDLADQMKENTSLYSLESKHSIVQLLLSIAQMLRFCEDVTKVVAQLGREQLETAFRDTSQLKREIRLSLLRTFGKVHPPFKNELTTYWIRELDGSRFNMVYLPLFTEKMIDTTRAYPLLAQYISDNQRNAFYFGYRVILDTPEEKDHILGFSPKLLDALSTQAYCHPDVDISAILPQITSSQETRKHLITYVDQMPSLAGNMIKDFGYYCQVYHMTQSAKQNAINERFSGLINKPQEYEQTMRVLLNYVLEEYTKAMNQIRMSDQQDIDLSSSSFQRIDMLSQLMANMMYMSSDTNARLDMFKATLKVISTFTTEKATLNTVHFKQRPFLRLYSNLLHHMSFLSANFEQYIQLLVLVANTFLKLSPKRLPVFCFAWMDLISHCKFMPLLLGSGSKIPAELHDEAESKYHALLIELFRFLYPFLMAKKELDEPQRLLHRSTIKLLLLLNHDFSNFLCNYCFSLCDEIPVHCIQMHNLILSAFPKGDFLTDPRKYQIQNPSIVSEKLPIMKSDYEAAIRDASFNGQPLQHLVHSYLKNRNPIELLNNLKYILLNPTKEALRTGQRYNRKLINSLVIYMAAETVQIECENQRVGNIKNPTFPLDKLSRSTLFEIVRRILFDLDSEGRFIFLETLTSQLRSPNVYTFMFCYMFLHLFDIESDNPKVDYIRDQMQRVLWERSAICKPHCWGALLTVTKLSNHRQAQQAAAQQVYASNYGATQ